MSFPLLLVPHCLLDALCFQEGFAIFFFRLGVRDDSCAHVIGEEVTGAISDESANGDVELGVAIEAEIAEGPSIKAARDGFEFRDDLDGPFFRGSGDAAPWKEGLQGIELVEIPGELAGDRGDEVMDLFESFMAAEVEDGDRSELRNLTEVVSYEIGDHHEFGEFLLRGLEFEG